MQKKSQRLFKAFKKLFKNDNVLRKSSNNRNQIYTKENVAVTLTTDLPVHKHQSATLLNLDHSIFIPPQFQTITYDQQVFVHYEPKKSQVILGTNPDVRHLKLTLKQFAWLIQQLNEEKHTRDSVQAHYTSNDTLLPVPSVIGFFSVKNSYSLKRFLQFISTKNVSRDKIHHQCVFIIPKALLLQAADLISLESPLPSLSDYTYALLSTSSLSRLKQYCRCLAYCSHELLMSLHTPDSLSQSVSVQCAECSLNTGLESIDTATHSPTYDQKSVMFPVSYIRYTLDSENTTNITESGSEESEYSLSPQKYGYVALDTTAKEIVVVFPGMAASRHMFENVSFQPTPWLEEQPRGQEDPYVLECAYTAWLRCELKVVTLLMRLCSTMPADYKVVIIGCSLGGGKL